MDVVLKGSSPTTLTAGILLLSKARSFGIPYLAVSVLGDESEITPVEGPALLHSNVLASCGVGRELGQGATVIVPGPPGSPLLVSIARDGLGGWFELDTLGVGAHPATQAFVRLSRDRRPAASHLGRNLRGLLSDLGIPPEPALLDLLFQAAAPPLSRLALALRAGRAITGTDGLPVTRWTTEAIDGLPDPLPSNLPGEEILEMHTDGRLDPYLRRLSLGARDRVEDWLHSMAEVAADDGGRDLDVVGAMAELASHLCALPPIGMLPPPNAAADAVASNLGKALGATQGERDASRQLLKVFRFLGGRFVDDARHPITLPSSPAPEDRLARWKWFVAGASAAAAEADTLWRTVMDPAS